MLGDEQGMVVGHLAGIHAVLVVSLFVWQQSDDFPIFRMVLQVLEEAGNGGKHIIRNVAAGCSRIGDVLRLIELLGNSEGMLRCKAILRIGFLL